MVIVLGNYTAHPNISSTLKSIKRIFLSPQNPTSITQPMDQGIVASFKSHYHFYLVQHG